MHKKDQALSESITVLVTLGDLEWTNPKSEKAAEGILAVLDKDYENNELFAMAMVRYMFWKKIWRLGKEGSWKDVLHKFFSADVERDYNYKNYIPKTAELIKEAFDEDIPEPVIEAARKVRKPRSSRKGSVPKRTVKKAVKAVKGRKKVGVDPIEKVEGYDGLSDRMKKVIKIQRS